MSDNESKFSIQNIVISPRMAEQESRTFFQQVIPTFVGYDRLETFPSPSEISTVDKPRQVFIRHSVKNSSNASKSKRTYYCQICRISCKDYLSYQAHLHGSKHKGKKLAQRKSVNRSAKIDTDPLRCQLCDITCPSLDNFNAHLSGKKHKITMKLHCRLVNTIPSAESQPMDSTPSPSNFGSQVLTNGFQILTDDEPSISVSCLNENSIQAVGEEYITKINKGKKRKYYRCQLCKCRFTDIKGKETHLKGKRHRLLYQSNLKRFKPKYNVEDKCSTSSESISNSHTGPSINYQSEIDNDTQCLMVLHQQIIPSQNLINIVEAFVNGVELALQSCSEQLQRLPIDSYKFPLIGVARVGLLGKSLLIKSDRSFDLVVLCTNWPTKTLFQTIGEILLENFYNEWKDKIRLQCQQESETIELETNTEEGMMRICLRFTSPLIEEQENSSTSEEGLSKINCLNALDAIRSTRWLQHQVSIRQNALALIRCLRYKTKISTNWNALSSEAIEILIDYAFLQSFAAIDAFRRVLECLSDGLILSDYVDFCNSWPRHSMKDIFENLNNQERNDITQEAQLGVRLLSFGQLAKWFEQSTLPILANRSYSSDFKNPSKCDICSF